jgi:hypothetical protein
VTQNSRGPKTSDKLGYSLPYSPGKAVVADFVLRREIKEASNNSDSNRWFYTYITYRPAKDAEKRELLDSIKESKSGAAEWFQE